jgi:cysteine-rich repeat protein
VKFGLRAWVLVVLVASGCSSSGVPTPTPEAAPVCGDLHVDEGEVCDEPFDADLGGCADDCKSYCGNGKVEGPELCDDGNAEDGDSCPADCLATCGNGEVEGEETCDDGNDELGDGCYRCRVRGDLMWESPDTCDGGISRGNADTLLVSCWSDPTRLFARYGLDGSRTDGPPPPADPNEEYNTPVLLAEQPSGDYYVVTAVSRNSTTANQPRVRVYRLAADGGVLWFRNLTAFPDGPDEDVGALAVNQGTLVVAGVSRPEATKRDSYPYLALLTEAGELRWKKILKARVYGSASAVTLAEDGTMFAAGVWDLDPDTGLPSRVWISAFDAEGTELWTRGKPLGVIGKVRDLRLSANELQVMLETVVQDDLVPNPPRLTATIEIIGLDPASGESTTSRVLTTRQTDGEAWRAVEERLPRGGFSDSDVLDSYSYAVDAALGYGSDGQEVFRAVSAPPASATRVHGSLALDHLLCLNSVPRDSALLSCYLTQ